MIGEKHFSFIALGGGNNVGGSCYALRAGDNIILLDAGIRYTADFVTRLPDVKPLYDFWKIEGLWDIRALVISHSHNDHAGAIPFFAQNMTGGKIYSSEAVPEMIFAVNSPASKSADMIIPVPYGEKYYAGGWAITLFPAGHIPGASMTLLEIDGAKILYTGDFCTFDQFTVNGANIPEMKIDTLICETTYGYTKSSGKTDINILAEKINSAMNRTGTFTCTLRNAGKESEFALAVNECVNLSLIPDIDIWIDPEFSGICSAVSKWGKSQILGGRVRLLDDWRNFHGGCVITPGNFGGYYELGFNMPNHSGCDEILNLIARTKPDRIIFIHGIPLTGGTRNILQEVRERFGSSIETIHSTDGTETNLLRE